LPVVSLPPGVTIAGPSIDITRPSLAHQLPSIASARAPSGVIAAASIASPSTGANAFADMERAPSRSSAARIRSPHPMNNDA
jgi:hypothetical protein